MAPRNRNDPSRSASSDGTYTRTDLEREFPDDATCLDWLWRKHFSDDGSHAECPKCETVRKFHRVASRPSWSCDVCGHHIHPTAGTIFHKSSTGLDTWFKAIFIMSSTRCGVSAKQLERELGVTYKTAWRMAHLIRTKLMVQDDETLSGEVEMDEMYVGGKPRASETAKLKGLPSWQRQKAAAKQSYAKKTKVFGMVERGGSVSAHVVEDTKRDTLMPRVTGRVMPATMIYTDEAPVYTSLPAVGYQHKRIHHAARVYVDGDIHTNTIEGFWSLVKRGIGGTHHAVSAKHLQTYLDEYVWRYNHRDDRRPMFLSLLASIGTAS
jgi:transposase